MKRITKLLLFLIVLPIFLTNIIAQEYDEYGNVNIKGLSEEDMVRLFGDKYSPKFFKVNGEKKAIKESLINGNSITTWIWI